MTTSGLLYLFLSLLGLFGIIIVIIINRLRNKSKKAYITFIQTKKGITTKIHFINVNKEKEKEILRDIKFDLMQIESKIKSQLDTPIVIKWKNSVLK